MSLCQHAANAPERWFIPLAHVVASDIKLLNSADPSGKWGVVVVQFLGWDESGICRLALTVNDDPDVRQAHCENLPKPMEAASEVSFKAEWPSGLRR